MHLARFPRRRYTAAPTPIEPLARPGEHLGGPTLVIKRDDLLGLPRAATRPASSSSWWPRPWRRVPTR